jgi:hypothetical protein
MWIRIRMGWAGVSSGDHVLTELVRCGMEVVERKGTLTDESVK